MITGFHWDTTLPDTEAHTHMHTHGVMRGRARSELPSTWLKRRCRAKTELVTSEEVLQHRSTGVDPFTTDQYVLVSLRIDGVIVFFSFSFLYPVLPAWLYCCLDAIENGTSRGPAANVWMHTVNVHTQIKTNTWITRSSQTQSTQKHSVAILGHHSLYSNCKLLKDVSRVLCAKAVREVCVLFLIKMKCSQECDSFHGPGRSPLSSTLRNKKSIWQLLIFRMLHNAISKWTSGGKCKYLSDQMLF